VLSLASRSFIFAVVILVAFILVLAVRALILLVVVPILVVVDLIVVVVRVLVVVRLALVQIRRKVASRVADGDGGASQRHGACRHDAEPFAARQSTRLSIEPVDVMSSPARMVPLKSEVVIVCERHLTDETYVPRRVRNLVRQTVAHRPGN
jgi:hypothetical protein